MLAPSFLPATCVLEMTYKCNHKCLFCSCPWEANNGLKKRKELTVQEWKDCIKLMSEKGVYNIAFTGGEAILNKNIKEIIEFARSYISEYIETKDNVLVSEKNLLNYILSLMASLLIMRCFLFAKIIMSI